MSSTRSSLGKGPLHVVHVASEVAPFSETGGLGVVAGALPVALAAAGLHVSIITPCYQDVPAALSVPLDGPFEVTVGRTRVRTEVRLGRLDAAGNALEGDAIRDGAGVPVYLVKCDPAYGRPGLYGPRPSSDFPDNAWRFGLLAEAALEICRRLRLHPDILHCHDWQAGLVPLLCRERLGGWVKSVQTIHNLGYHGTFPPDTALELGLPTHLFNPEGFEFWGWLSFLKAGLVFSDRITTVSPSYAAEIQTPRHGHGLDGVLRARADQLVGILNGIPPERHSPSDPRLPAPFSDADLSGKSVCKAALCAELGLDDAPVPLIAVVSRLVAQKGMDLVVPGLWNRLDSGQIRLAVLGTGDPELERTLSALAQRFPGRASVRIAFDEPAARLVLAGADALLMPSRYEPCGLTQLFGLRYGTLPLARATGGLKDTIRPGETGFVWEDTSPHALDGTVGAFIEAYYDAPRLLAMRQAAMREDFSWVRSAGRYAALYEEVHGQS